MDGRSDSAMPNQSKLLQQILKPVEKTEKQNQMLRMKLQAFKAQNMKHHITLEKAPSLKVSPPLEIDAGLDDKEGNFQERLQQGLRRC